MSCHHHHHQQDWFTPNYDYDRAAYIGYQALARELIQAEHLGRHERRFADCNLLRL